MERSVIHSGFLKDDLPKGLRIINSRLPRLVVISLSSNLPTLRYSLSAKSNPISSHVSLRRRELFLSFRLGDEHTGGLCNDYSRPSAHVFLPGRQYDSNIYRSDALFV